MQILPEYGFPYLIDQVTGPVVPKFAWYYDVPTNDFMMKNIVMLEETTGPTVLCRINGTELRIPASWHILVCDEETKSVDTVQITKCGSSGFKAFMMHPQLNRYGLADVQLLDLDLEGEVVHLLIPRLTLVCHPVGPTQDSGALSMSVLIGPQDVGKHMGDLSAMELLI
jgi:hypothetical protein